MKLDPLIFGVSVENQDETAVDRLSKDQSPNTLPVLDLSEAILANREKATKEIAEEKEKNEEGEDYSNSSSDTTSSETTEEEEPEEEPKEEDSSNDTSSTSDDSSGGDDFGFDFDDISSDFDDSFDTEENEEDSKEEPEEEEKPEEESKEESEEEEKPEEESKEEEPSEESYENAKKLSWDVFKSLKVLEREKYRSLRAIGVSVEELEEVKGNVAYAKEPILEALVNLSNIGRKYQSSTKLNINKLAESVPKLDSRITNFEKVRELGEITFTNEIVSDPTILKAISIDNVCNLRESLKRMRRYNKDANDLCTLVSKNREGDLKDTFLSKRFNEVGEILEYSQKLPGFRTVRAIIPEFINYAKTSIGSYSYSYVEETNPNLLYDLKPISITEEVEVAYIIESLRELILELSTSVDILNQINHNFSTYIDELKILRVNIEEDQYENLSQIGFDQKVKEFIIFKLIVEIISVNINIDFDYITGVISLLEKTIRLKTTEEIETPTTDENSEETEEEPQENPEDF